MSSKKWVIFSIIVVVFFGGMVYLSTLNKLDVSKYDSNNFIDSNDDNGGIADHTDGNKQSKISLIEYGDYQCPSCATMDKKIRKITEDYKDKISVTFRNFPLEIHPNALSAAAAVESAGLQGKYQQMHEKIYENQDEWSYAQGEERNNLFFKYAKELDLDEVKFKEGMKDPRVLKKIQFDKALGKKAAIRGTPSFILNGQEIDSNIWGDDAKLREKLDELVSQK